MAPAYRPPATVAIPPQFKEEPGWAVATPSDAVRIHERGIIYAPDYVINAGGIINVALLNFAEEPVPGFETQKDYEGLIHFGMWVDELDSAEKVMQANGGTYLAGRPTSPNSYYECKYRDPDGIVFDVTHNGWAGAVKDVVPAKTEA